MKFLNQNLSKDVDRETIGKIKDATKIELALIGKCKSFLTYSSNTLRCNVSGVQMHFVWKQYERNEILRYKTRFVAQEFLQRPDIEYIEKIFLIYY